MANSADPCTGSGALIDRRTMLLGLAALPFAIRLPAGAGIPAEPVRSGVDDIGLMTFADELRLGRQFYADLLSSARVSTDRRRIQAMESVVKRLTSLSSIPRGQWEWEVRLVVDDEVNAAAILGGKLVITTAMDSFTRGDPDELAVVFGHEVAHVTERHGAKQIRNMSIARSIAERLRGSLRDLDRSSRDELLKVLEAGTLVGAGLPYGRRQERAADRVGLNFAAQAGFAASDAIPFWRRMSDAFPSTAKGNFLSTHPSGEDRIARLTEELKKLP